MKKITAPQKPLQSSWVDIVFKKTKSQSVIKKSLGIRPTMISKHRGVLVGSGSIQSNQY